MTTPQDNLWWRWRVGRILLILLLLFLFKLCKTDRTIFGNKFFKVRVLLFLVLLQFSEFRFEIRLSLTFSQTYHDNSYENHCYPQVEDYFENRKLVDTFSLVELRDQLEWALDGSWIFFWLEQTFLLLENIITVAVRHNLLGSFSGDDSELSITRTDEDQQTVIRLPITDLPKIKYLFSVLSCSLTKREIPSRHLIYHQNTDLEPFYLVYLCI